MVPDTFSAADSGVSAIGSDGEGGLRGDRPLGSAGTNRGDSPRAEAGI